MQYFERLAFFFLVFLFLTNQVYTDINYISRHEYVAIVK